MALFTPAVTARFLTQALIWGSSFTLIRVADAGLSADLVVLSRLALAAVALVALCAVQHQRLVSGRRAWGHTAVAALLGNVVPYLALTWGERGTSAGVAGVLIGATPLLTVLLAALALRDERLSRVRTTGFVVALAGVVVVVHPLGGGIGAPMSNLACLGAAVSYAAGYVYVRRFLSGVDVGPLGAATSQLLAATVILGVATPFAGGEVLHLTPAVIGAVVALGLLSTGYGTVLYFQLIRDLGAGLASSVDYLVPVVAVLVGVVVGGERLTPALAAGAVLILAGMLVAEGRLSQGRRAALPPATAPATVPATAPCGGAGVS